MTTEERMEQIKLHMEKAQEMWDSLIVFCNDCLLEETKENKMVHKITGVVVLGIGEDSMALMKCGSIDPLRAYLALMRAISVLTPFSPIGLADLDTPNPLSE